MNKYLNRALNEIHSRLGKYLGKPEIEVEQISEDPYSIVFMNTSSEVHVMLVQGDFSEAIPEDGSFKGAYVVTFPSLEQANEHMEQFKLNAKGFTRIE